jgi:hypothetical protein
LGILKLNIDAKRVELSFGTFIFGTLIIYESNFGTSSMFMSFW